MQVQYVHATIVCSIIMELCLPSNDPVQISVHRVNEVISSKLKSYGSYVCVCKLATCMYICVGIC